MLVGFFTFTNAEQATATSLSCIDASSEKLSHDIFILQEKEIIIAKFVFFFLKKRKF